VIGTTHSSECRVARRSGDPVDNRNSTVGLRLARTVPTDADGDGYFMYEDCNDNDPKIYPQAGDSWGDGIDSDCDGDDCEAVGIGTAYFAACPGAGSWSAGQTQCINRG
jgi:hypothetical protein